MISFAAVGDCFITRNAPEGDSRVQLITDLLVKNDVRLANLEVCLNEGEIFPSAVSGGTWACAHPSVLGSLKKYGFNMLSWANNHTLDFLHSGLILTKAHLESSGIVHAGSGKNLAEASKPQYLDTANGRVALISCVTTAPPTWIAGDQRNDSLGRPGVNLIRTKTMFKVKKEDIKHLNELTKELPINVKNELDIDHGFLPELPDGVLSFGDYQFVESRERSELVTINDKDLDRIRRSIELAKHNSDYVIISLHAHEMEGNNNHEPAKFIIDLARSFINFGAQAVICHGPHLVRGIEIYQECPIFYSLGNFIYQPESVSFQPADVYEQFNLDNTHNLSDLFDKMTRNNSIGHYTIKEMWQSIIPIWKMKNGKLVDLKIYPLSLGYGLDKHQMGWPELSDDLTVLERIKKLSLDFETNIEIDANKGIVCANAYAFR